MPSTSKKQHKFMQAVAHSPEFAKKVGVPQSVGKDFSNADKGRKFKEGGNTMATKSMKALFAGKETKAEEKAEKKAFPTKAGYQKAEAKFEGEKYAKGGVTSLAKHASMPASKAHAGLKAGGSIGTTKMGSVKTKPGNIDGIAVKGKTKGSMVKMARGGKAC